MSSNNPCLGDKEPMGSSEIGIKDTFVELDQVEDGELEDFGDAAFKKRINKRIAYGLVKRKPRNLFTPCIRLMLFVIFLTSFVLVVFMGYQDNQGRPPNFISSNQKESQVERSNSYSPVSSHSYRLPAFDMQMADKALPKVYEDLRDQYNQKLLERWDSRNDKPAANNRNFELRTKLYQLKKGRQLANTDSMGIASDFRSQLAQGGRFHHMFGVPPSGIRESGNHLRFDSRVPWAPRSITPQIEDSSLDPRLEVSPRFNKKEFSDPLTEKMQTVENKENQHRRREIVEERSPKKGPIIGPPSSSTSSESSKKPEPNAAGNSTVDSKSNSVTIRDKGKKTKKANGKKKKKSGSIKSN